ncbi:MAG: glycosyl hydrolase 115 family protein [Candidatus Dadabacteria bacterium]
MKKGLFIFSILYFAASVKAQSLISDHNNKGDFPLFSSSLGVAAIYTDSTDDWLVQKAAFLLQADIQKVTGKSPLVIHKLSPANKNVIIIGTTGSAVFKNLEQKQLVNLRDIRNKWETSRLVVTNNPLNAKGKAFVITGSDKRGTAYGVFELSKQIGVSPWYWWADVPVKKRDMIYVKNGTYTYGSPSVKYRGIFINDEAPAFSGWTKEKFGGVNHLVYEKIFELLLRLKGNYLWPAMWGNAFNDDDTLNPVLANKWGIVMGTSHHEPMLRAQQEWKRYGRGEWNYEKNAAVLDSFWRKGIQNMDSHESIVTIGMRGDGDMPMTQGTAISLLERIVSNQRKIIEEVTHKPASATPQLWALYKEVQDYYDKGMRVPDDVTLLLCDDNWGNIRRLPKLTDKPRGGGYGIYYHFDYVGGPRNYKWINTNNISRVWEQMHLAYSHGVDKIWIVNVGDLKPMEFPISFFLDYAYDTKKWNQDNLLKYYPTWAAEQFGGNYAKQIGEVLQKYSKYISRRKPELLDASTYSLQNYNEAERVLSEWKLLLAEAEAINAKLSPAYKDAYFQLILHPVKAAANLHEMYYAVAKNKVLAAANQIEANKWADLAKKYYITDSLLSVQYNKEIANGKWNHMMDQTHIGYTYWQQPPVNKMPSINYISKSTIFSDPLSLDVIPSKFSIADQVKRAEYKFREQDGYISILADHYTKAVNKAAFQWKVIPNIGREGNGITSFPVTDSAVLSASGPHLEYEFTCTSTGPTKVNAYFSPTLNFYNDAGLRYAVSIDNEPPQVISINKDDANLRTWESWVANNIIIKTSLHNIKMPGKHILKYWMISPAVVLQKLVLDFGGVKQSYLGPPETKI